MKVQATTMTRKGRITIPAEIRRAMGLKVGDPVLVSLDEESGDHQATLRPAPSVADATFGALRSYNRPIDPADVHDSFMQHAVERDERSKRT